MIYDTPIDILQLPDTVGTPMQGKLQKVFSAFCTQSHRSSYEHAYRIECEWPHAFR